MRDIVFGSVGEVLGLVFYSVVASVLAVGGALVELAARQDLSAGQTTLGLWEVGLGLILLYAGYSVATEFVLPELRESESTA